MKESVSPGAAPAFEQPSTHNVFMDVNAPSESGTVPLRLLPGNDLPFAHQSSHGIAPAFE